MRRDNMINNLQIILRDFASKRDWEQFHTPKNLTMAINTEAGELSELYQWSEKADMEKVSSEIADIFIYLLRLVDVLNINLASITTRKIKENDKKYPIEKARGNARKYTEL
jgi:NTP pyrophosphatase (non-canonical NTP hydrolase)